MLEIQGKYNTAKVFTDNIENEAYTQILNMMCQIWAKDMNVAIMPDVHAGKGCTVGTTMTIKDKIVPNLVGVDIGCFTKDTKVALADGRSLSFEEMIKENGEYYGYSLTNEGNVAISKLEFPRKIKENQPLLKITLDNGEIIKCTYDHIFYKRDMSQIEAQHLKIGDSLYPLYIKKAKDINTDEINCKHKLRNKLNEYNCVYDVKLNKWSFIHNLADEYNFRNGLTSLSGSFVRHHKDFNKYNNNPTNIVRMTFKDHLKLHSSLASEMNKLGISGYKAAIKKYPNLCSNAGKIGASITWNNDKTEKTREKAKKNITNWNKSKEARKLASERQLKNNTQKFSKWNGSEWLLNRQKLSRIRKVFNDIVSNNEKISKDTYEKYRINYYNYPYWEKVEKLLKTLSFTYDDVLNNKKPLNHRIVSIEKIDNEDVYCLTCSEFGNFALSSGVFVHNCGMLVAKIKTKGHIEFGKLDKLIKEKIPSGKEHRNDKHRFAKDFEQFDNLIANVRREELNSIGSLGGGNHFIEVDKDDEGNFYVVIHSGSRHLGVAVCEYWQNVAIKECEQKTQERGAIVAKYREQGKTDKEIDELMKDYDHFSVPKILSYLSGESFNNYLHDMAIVQEFANQNRQAMLDVIIKGMGWKVQEQFTTIHNYIDIKNMILRKGSISAQEGERVIIPMNMRDGSLICIGKGNPEWNYSAPHGAGRLMSRADAKNSISMKDYKDAMKGIYTTCVSSATVDESPMAYKPMEEIIKNIEPTCSIEKIIKPVYNFKAAF